ncbi:hypothetical protein [Pseudomonas syringae]|uniref:hypothetical protein n=1 Tax=Pseudomonas syringae TaxID=317 RepID=UPI000E31232D|nr:hypothetical protein [Pseudomonas syringae]
MMNVKQSKARSMKMAEKAAAVMDVQFPNFPEAWLWIRKVNHGYSTIPRTLPIAMQALNEIKGHPAGHTLMCLWARAPDHPLVVIESQATFAGEAGFTGARMVDTWRRRMKILKKYDFIYTKKGTSGEFHYVLLLNPNAAIEKMWTQNLISDDLYARFIERMADIGGSNDLVRIREYWEQQRIAEEEKAKAEAEAKKTADAEAEKSTEAPEPKAKAPRRKRVAPVPK